MQLPDIQTVAFTCPRCKLPVYVRVRIRMASRRDILIAVEGAGVEEHLAGHKRREPGSGEQDHEGGHAGPLRT